jgi:hypothetical protein
MDTFTTTTGLVELAMAGGFGLSLWLRGAGWTSCPASSLGDRARSPDAVTSPAALDTNQKVCETFVARFLA